MTIPCLVAALISVPWSAVADRPNVLFIMAADLRCGLGPYGSAARTPNLDRLARRAVQFTRFLPAH